MTTIHGGTIPIRNFAPQSLPGVGVKIVYGIANITVEGIRFAESALQSMYTQGAAILPGVAQELAARGLTASVSIIRNEFIDVKPQYDFFWYALAAVTDGPAGAVRIEQNRAHFTSGRWDQAERSYESSNGVPRRREFWEGLSVAELHHAGALIDNTIEGTDVGVLVYFSGNEYVRVSDNHVELRPEGSVGMFLSANHKYLIERNTVIASGRNPDGIILSGDDPVAGINDSTVRHNVVTLSGSYFGGISLYGGGTNNYIAQNRVNGSAAYAFGLVSDFAPDVATSNVLAGNNISHFTPADSPFFGSGADVFFDAHTFSNVWAGSSGIVKDLGVDNSVTGQSIRGNGPGPQLRDALMAKRELLRRAP